MHPHSTYPTKCIHVRARAASQGDITAKLFPDECPKTVENFTTHAKNGCARARAGQRGAAAACA